MTNTPEGLGTIVIDEVVAVVIRIHMQAGAFIVTGRIPGPISERPEGEYDCRVHGVDGVVVMGGRIHTGWPSARPGDSVEFAFAAMPSENEFTERGYPHPLAEEGYE